MKMPIAKPVKAKCQRCGREVEIITAPTHDKLGQPTHESPAYWICPQCKTELEGNNLELARHIGKSVEEEFRIKE